MGASALGEEAIWTSQAPPFEEAVALETPVFLGPPVRPNLLPAAGRLALQPLAARAVFKKGIGVRDLMSFAMWRETAMALGIRRVIRTDGSESAFSSLLPPPATSRAYSSRPPAVGLAMIVQNEERRLGDCLGSVSQWVAEIVVVDGGSTDRTREIATSFGATVIDRPFDGDYAAQRNVGIRAISTPWILVLDADERLSPELPPVLDHLASSGLADGAYMHFLNLLVGETAPWFWPDRKLRFFRSGNVMSGRIHEGVRGLRRPVYLPISGPFILHSKTLSEQWDREKQYYEMDPSYYSEEDAKRIAEWRANDGDLPAPGPD